MTPTDGAKKCVRLVACYGRFVSEERHCAPCPMTFATLLHASFASVVTRPPIREAHCTFCPSVSPSVPGRKSRVSGGRVFPECRMVDANASCPPADFVVFQSFKHHIACITKMRDEGTDKKYRSEFTKHFISSEKFDFSRPLPKTTSWWEGYPLPHISLAPNQTFWIGPSVSQNSSYTPMRLSSVYATWSPVQVARQVCSDSLSDIKYSTSPSPFNGCFPGEPGLAGSTSLVFVHFERQPLRQAAHAFTGGMLFLSPSQQCQSTEGNSEHSPQLRTLPYIGFILFSSTTGLHREPALKKRVRVT